MVTNEYSTLWMLLSGLVMFESYKLNICNMCGFVCRGFRLSSSLLIRLIVH